MNPDPAVIVLEAGLPRLAQYADELPVLPPRPKPRKKVAWHIPVAVSGAGPAGSEDVGNMTPVVWDYATGTWRTELDPAMQAVKELIYDYVDVVAFDRPHGLHPTASYMWKPGSSTRLWYENALINTHTQDLSPLVNLFPGKEYSVYLGSPRGEEPPWADKVPDAGAFKPNPEHFLNPGAYLDYALAIPGLKYAAFDAWDVQCRDGGGSTVVRDYIEARGVEVLWESNWPAGRVDAASIGLYTFWDSYNGYDKDGEWRAGWKDADWGPRLPADVAGTVCMATFQGPEHLKPHRSAESCAWQYQAALDAAVHPDVDLIIIDFDDLHKHGHDIIALAKAVRGE